jgi:hypothetical protein
MTEETKDVSATATAAAAQPAPEQQAPAGPDLNISDLSAIKSIIDIASQRGAFKAAELESVGKIYNKLDKFLEAVTKKEA